MMSAFLFTALIPLALLAVLGIALAGDRMAPAMRSRIEGVLVAVVYPGLILWWLWQAVAHFRHGEPILGMLFGVAAVGALHEFLKLMRRRRAQARAKAAE